MKIELSSIDVLKALGFVVVYEEDVLYQNKWGDDYHNVLTIFWQDDVVFQRVVDWSETVEEICQKWFVNKFLGRNYM